MTTSSAKYCSLPELIAIGNFEGLEGIFDDISNGITITDEHSRIIYVNSAFTNITGYKAQEVVGDNPGILHSGRHDKKYYERMWEDLNQLGRWQGEIWNRHKSGEIVPELLTITKIINKKQQIFYIGVFSDISFLVQENETKINLALHDPLTGLCNRALLEDRFLMIRQEYDRGESDPQFHNHQVAVLFIDLDHFKQINDTHGHLVGDAVLIFVAHVLKTFTRSIDSVARFGGDEFVVILSKINSHEDVEAYCGRVKEAISHGKYFDSLLLIPKLSVGVSFFPTQATEFDKLIADADKAMYHSKKHGTFLTFYTSEKEH